jgi:hypothetical protein
MFAFKLRKSSGKRERIIQRPLIEGLESRQLLSTTIFIGNGTLEPITENQPITNNTVARVAAYDVQDHPLTDLSGFTAKIDWGDGTGQSDGTVGLSVGGNYYAIEGSHTYAKAGNYPISVHIVAIDGTSADSYVETAGVEDAALSARSNLIQANVGVQFTSALATLSDANQNSQSIDFTADIQWGDASPTDRAQVVAVGAGQYQLIGSHTYQTPGQYYAQITATDTGGQRVSTNCLIDVAPATTPTQPPANPTTPPGNDPGTGNPTNPTDPTNPTKPTNPTNPTTPGDPANPTQPTNPTNPNTPPNPAQPPSNPGTGATGPIAWGKKVSPAFKAKVELIASELGTDPNYLMGAMAFETGGTFSPKIRNKAGSGAIGLIQFMPSTARSLGTSTAALAKMSAVQQLDYVYAYLAPCAGKLNSLSDVYMAILYPAAVGQSDSYALFDKGTKAYTQNKGLDTNKDGVVTKGEAAARVTRTLEQGMNPPHYG